MTHSLRRLLPLLTTLLLTMSSCRTSSLLWNELAPLPDTVGLAGPFVGVAGDALVVAGGANFPTGRPWTGAAKVFHDRIHVLEHPDGAWKTLPLRLPRPIAYGACASTPSGIVCVGGADAQRHYADAFLVRYEHGEARIEALPPLPAPLAYAAAAAIGDRLYVAGGTDAPEATRAAGTFLRLDLSKQPRAWEMLPPCPGPGRHLAMLAAQGGAVYLAGGVALEADDAGKPRRVQPYLNDAGRFDPSAGTWSRLGDLPHPVAAASAAGAPDRIRIFSGDPGTLGGAALRDAHPGFPAEILSLLIPSHTWIADGELPKSPGPDPANQPEAGVWPAVTTHAVWWRGRLIIPTGEARPGVRTSRVLAAQ